MINEKLTEIYELLLQHFGAQNWWPGETQFEIITGAILTQNTNWANVEKAINNLKAENLLNPESIYRMQTSKLEKLIRPAGYYKVKAKRLKNFINRLFENYNGSIEQLDMVNTEQLRAELLGIKGIGYETADSILLYALKRKVFVVDAYTARIAVRHGLIVPPFDYEQLRELFQSNLPQDVKLFNEYHALIVKLGKEFCKRKPKCPDCPLEKLPHTIESEHI
ncbi:MAG TPA: endonuclease III domain-containing protein [Planctomycetes bacterium]|nr:endonuclease III domain-containing protein [Planctomycetota bacterium]